MALVPRGFSFGLPKCVQEPIPKRDVPKEVPQRQGPKYIIEPTASKGLDNPERLLPERDRIRGFVRRVVPRFGGRELATSPTLSVREACELPEFGRHNVPVETRSGSCGSSTSSTSNPVKAHEPGSTSNQDSIRMVAPPPGLAYSQPLSISMRPHGVSWAERQGNVKLVRPPPGIGFQEARLISVSPTTS